MLQNGLDGIFLCAFPKISQLNKRVRDSGLKQLLSVIISNALYDIFCYCKYTDSINKTFLKYIVTYTPIKSCDP